MICAPEMCEKVKAFFLTESTWLEIQMARSHIGETCVAKKVFKNIWTIQLIVILSLDSWQVDISSSDCKTLPPIAKNLIKITLTSWKLNCTLFDRLAVSLWSEDGIWMKSYFAFSHVPAYFSIWSKIWNKRWRFKCYHILSSFSNAAYTFPPVPLFLIFQEIRTKLCFSILFTCRTLFTSCSNICHFPHLAQASKSFKKGFGIFLETILHNFTPRGDFS